MIARAAVVGADRVAGGRWARRRARSRLWIARLRGASGVGYVMEAIVLGRARIPLLRSLLQALASWLAIATGNSLGREGPLIQFGAAAGEGARRWLEARRCARTARARRRCRRRIRGRV